ncbi:MAG: MFS transporter [Haloferacaceae archaeon]
MAAVRDALARTAKLTLGAEGDVAADSEAQSMTIASAMLALGVVVLSPLMLDLATVFEVSESRVGLLISVYTAPPIVLIPVAGVLADRIGRKPLLVGGLVLFGLGGGAIGLVQSFEAALVLRFVQGVGFAAAMPLTITVLGDVYRGSREATVQGLRTAGNFVSNTVGPVVAAVLIAVAWQYPFALFLLTLPIALWVWVALPTTAPVAESSLRGYVRDLFQLIRRPDMALILLSFGLRFVVFYGFLTYVSFLGKQTIGVTTVIVGIVTSVKAIGSILGSTQAGRLTLRGHTALVAATAFGFMGVGMLLAGAVPTLATLVLGAVLLGIGDGVIAPVQKSLVTNLAPAQLRAGAISSSSTVQNAGKAAAPVALSGVLATAGPPAVFVALGAIGIVGAGLLVVVWRLTREVDVLV